MIYDRFVYEISRRTSFGLVTRQATKTVFSVRPQREETNGVRGLEAERTRWTPKRFGHRRPTLPAYKLPEAKRWCWNCWYRSCVRRTRVWRSGLAANSSRPRWTRTQSLRPTYGNRTARRSSDTDSLATSRCRWCARSAVPPRRYTDAHGTIVSLVRAKNKHTGNLDGRVGRRAVRCSADISSIGFPRLAARIRFFFLFFFSAPFGRFSCATVVAWTV